MRMMKYFRSRQRLPLAQQTKRKPILPQKPDCPHYFGWGRLVRVNDGIRVSSSVVLEVVWDLVVGLPYCGILGHDSIQLRLGDVQDAAYGIEGAEIGAGTEFVLDLLDDGLS